MADPTWGMLAKALDDAQTINEAITEAIAAHEADSNAHLGAGESLETHRAGEVIDHPAESIVPDKIIKTFYSEQIIAASFQSLDAFTAVGYIVSLEFGGVLMATIGTLNAMCQIATVSANITTAQMDKNPQLDMTIASYGQDTHEAAWGMGGLLPQFDDFFIGFWWDGSDLYGRIVNFDDSTDVTVFLADTKDNAFHNYTVKYNVGVGADFYFFDW